MPRYLILVLASTVAIYPMFWVVAVAFKTQAEYMLDPMALPSMLNMSNFAAVIGDAMFRRYIFNSVTVVVAAVPLVTICSAAAGYALARLWGRGGMVVLFVFLVSEFIPIAILVIPLYLTINTMGIDHGVVRLIFVYSVVLMGFSVLVFRAFFRSIPEELREAARLDGASEIQVFRRIMLPLARSPMTLVAVVAFLVMWNEFFLAAVLIGSVEHRTLPLGLTAFRGQYATDWPKVAAALVLSTIPTLVLYAIFQGRIARPFTRSTVRG